MKLWFHSNSASSRTPQNTGWSAKDLLWVMLLASVTMLLYECGSARHARSHSHTIQVSHPVPCAGPNLTAI